MFLSKKKEAAIWERQPLTKKKINELYFAKYIIFFTHIAFSLIEIPKNE
jgi:hypothetical protein